MKMCVLAQAAQPRLAVIPTVLIGGCATDPGRDGN